MSCELAHLDGAYVLGALSPSERLEFERHLAGCRSCSASVRELAGLPGLLAQVQPEHLEAPPAEPLPETLLPALVREVHRAQRRRSALVAAVAAGVTVVALGAAGVVTGVVRQGGPVAAPPSTTVTSSPAGRAMDQVGKTPVEANVLVSPVAWGTRLDLTCSYAGIDAQHQYDASPAATYALVVRTRDGSAEQVATWHGLPGRTMHLSGATATRRQDIQAVELRTADGLVVLRLAV
jgi:Putative zinc-finger